MNFREQFMKIHFSDLWRWDGNIDRAQYLFFGLILFGIKFGLDWIIASFFFNSSWSIFDYAREGGLLAFPSNRTATQLLVLLAISIPFLWSGVVLTIRRLRSAGLWPGLVILFVAPVIKLLLFALLCLLPPRELRSARPHGTVRPRDFLEKIIPRHPVGNAAVAVFFTLLLTLAAVWFGTTVLKDYGWALFVGLPFWLGFISTLIFCFHQPRRLGGCLQVSLCTILFAGAGLLLIGFEGMICIIMAAPLAIIMAVIGGLAAYAIQKGWRWRNDSSNLFCVAILWTPLMMGLEHYEKPAPPLLEIKTSVEVNASPEKVWRNVVSFSDLPPAKEWLFRLGVAYPVRAEIQGRGRGAVRYCNFSTGSFVEPIEIWDEPRELEFSVSENPPAMEELTFYKGLHPPHLDGYLVSKRGRFRLVALPNNRTRLEGTTWYQHNLWPSRYWQIWSDHIIHRIHLRVLNHVKLLSESAEKP
jgi:uncharacterized membrane protein YhaH (DUF805 family)